MSLALVMAAVVTLQRYKDRENLLRLNVVKGEDGAGAVTGQGRGGSRA